MKLAVISLSLLAAFSFGIRTEEIDTTILLYQDCYTSVISAVIQGCISDKYIEEKDNYEKARKVFIKNARDAGVNQSKLFNKASKKEKLLWEAYVINKCGMESASFLPESGVYWTSFYECQALEYKAKGES